MVNIWRFEGIGLDYLKTLNSSTIQQSGSQSSIITCAKNKAKFNIILPFIQVKHNISLYTV